MFRRFIAVAAAAVAALIVTAPGAQAATQTFSTNTLTSFDFGGTTPFPSSIPVSGLTGEVTKVTVALNGYTITDEADDIDVLLVGPQGQNVMLMSDVGGTGGAFDRNLVFDDAAIGSVPAPLVDAAFKPSNANTADDNGIDAPAPPPPYGSKLSAFEGTSGNGSWNLFIRDAVIPGDGNLDGWSVTISTKDAEPPPADKLSLELKAGKQGLSRKLAVDVDASEAGKLTFSGKARGSVEVEAGTSEIQARLDPGAFKKLKRKLAAGKKAGVVIEATLRTGAGEAAEDSTKVKLKAKRG